MGKRSSVSGTLERTVMGYHAQRGNQGNQVGFSFTRISHRLKHFIFWAFGLITSATALFVSFKLLS